MLIGNSTVSDLCAIILKGVKYVQAKYLKRALA